MYENPGGDTATLPPAADAHEYEPIPPAPKANVLHLCYLVGSTNDKTLKKSILCTAYRKFVSTRAFFL